MKLHILSDLHLGVQGMEHPQTDADIVVLAGDIARPAQAVAWAQGFGKPVLYVPGNHEFYGARHAQVLAELQRLSQGTQVRLLDNRSVTLAGVRFVGSTLWSDFRIFASEELRQQAMEQAQLGATLLDLNVGAPGIDEPVAMERAVFCASGAAGAAVLL